MLVYGWYGCLQRESGTGIQRHTYIRYTHGQTQRVDAFDGQGGVTFAGGRHWDSAHQVTVQRNQSRLRPVFRDIRRNCEPEVIINATWLASTWRVPRGNEIGLLTCVCRFTTCGPLGLVGEPPIRLLRYFVVADAGVLETIMLCHLVSRAGPRGN
jgi:hypothetical protein